MLSQCTPKQKSFDVPFDKLVEASAKRKGLTAEWVMPVLPDARLVRVFLHAQPQAQAQP